MAMVLATLARGPLSHRGAPVGVSTGLVGAPFFLMLLVRSRRQIVWHHRRRGSGRAMRSVRSFVASTSSRAAEVVALIGPNGAASRRSCAFSAD